MTANMDRRIKNQIKSWLGAVGIPAHVDRLNKTLHVTDSAGNCVVIETDLHGHSSAICVNPKDYTSRNLQRGLDAFRGLQVALGYEPKLPVDRGPAFEGKAHYSNNFELVAMRHTDFRRCPNPPPGKLESYGTVIETASRKFFRTNSVKCQDNLLGIGDLRTYAQLWTCEYITLMEDPTLDQRENERYLYKFLSQRFTEFRKVLDKKNRNVLPMLDDAFISLHGRTYDYANKASWYAADAEEDPSEVVADEQDEEQPEGPTLDEQLSAMGHDQMVAALKAAVENDRIHLDARREASKRLQAHAMKCDDCSGVDFPRAHGDDGIVGASPIVDENGRVFATPKDAAKKLGLYASNIRAVLSGRYKSTGGHVFKYQTT